ncbi:MAG: PHP-associated domain-containing protein [Asgard group archaeon]|nr:PHP-associated domain-containing protein [Asgard group archaeon]
MQKNQNPLSNKFHVLSIDPHVHVDEGMRYEYIPSVLKYYKLDAVGLLTHNDLAFSKKVAKKLQIADPSKIYFPGVEIDTSDGHLVAYGIKQKIPQGLSSEETIQLIKKQRGITIIPHPFMSHNSIGWKAYKLDADAMEFNNGFAKIFLNFPNIMCKVAFRYNGMAKLGGSDAHFAPAVGSCYSLIKIQGEITTENIFQAIREKRTIPKQRPLNSQDIGNFIRIVFGPKKNRQVVKLF